MYKYFTHSQASSRKLHINKLCVSNLHITKLFTISLQINKRIISN